MTGSIYKLPGPFAGRVIPVFFAALFFCFSNAGVGADESSAKPGKEWFNLSAEEARKGQPVSVQGTVLCYDLGWGQFYIHDGSNTIYLSPHYFTNHFRAGQFVKLTGTTTWDGTVPILTNTSATVVAERALPPPTALKLAELANFHGQWVKIRGLVHVAEASRNRVTLILRDGNQKCVVYVMQTSGASEFKKFDDCWVEIQGINASRMKNGRLDEAIVFSPGMDQVTVTAPARLDRWRLPVTAIDSLLTRPLGDWTNEPVHINGLVDAYEPGSSLTIKDPTGLLNAGVIQVNPALLYQRVDVWGFLSVTTNQASLRDAYFEVTGGSSGEAHPLAKPKPVSNNGPVLTSISQIRSLSKEKAGENLPALIRGVLTFVDLDQRVVFLQAGHEAIFLDTAQGDLQPGQWVEVNGQTDGRGFAPQLINCSTKILGTTNFPGAIKIELQDAANGQLDSQWVQLEGVVRRVNKEGGRIFLSLASPFGQFTAIVQDANAQPVPPGLLDSYIGVRGACGSVVNSCGQLNGITLHVPDRGEITVIDPSPPDPFSIATTPMSDIGTFNSRQLAGRRIKVAGTVTLLAPDRTLFLQDDSGGIRVQGPQIEEVHAGERIEALGFPALFEFSPCLQEAIIRRGGGTSIPDARPTTAAQILQSGKYDGLLVELDATVLQSLSGAARPKLTLQDGPIIFTAQVVQSGVGPPMPALSPGSLVMVRGVCAIQQDENHEPAAFHVLLADSRGVRLLRDAPWWTTRHTIMLVGGIFLGALLASIWVRSLRRQVRSQTKIIRQKQSELIEISRQAGMAEVATSVLHNVGNVLNSINVAATLAEDRIRKSGVNDLRRISKLIDDHAADRATFLTTDPKGKRIPEFLGHLAEKLNSEQAEVLEELGSLRGNVDHVKEIIAMQQSYARVSGVLENIEVTDLLEDAVRMNAGSLDRHDVKLVREYSPVPAICTDKHKVLQILINLVRNAKYACDESGRTDKQMTLRASNGGGRVRIAIIDNGVGIPPENLTRIFNYGFTTRKDGHGFGLHSGALAARELGGSLTVHSDGAGLGAAFTLELPVQNLPDGDTKILKNIRDRGVAGAK